MALVTCPECRSTVSSKARSCPRCGCPFKRTSGKPPSRVGRLLSRVVLPIALGCLGVYLVFGGAPFSVVRDKAQEALEKGDAAPVVSEAGTRLKQLARSLEDKLSGVIAKRPQGLELEVELPFLEKETFFPALYHLCGKHVAGFASTFARVRVGNGLDHDLDGLRIEVELEGFSKPAREVLDLPRGARQTVSITPTMSDAIAEVTEERPGQIRVSVVDRDGKTLKEVRRQIIIASRNDLSRSSFAYPLSAVFVTPNDPVVVEIVNEARRRVGSLRGYQGPPEQVRREVAAVYGILSDLGIGYRSAATSFINDRGMSGQKIHLPAESVQQTAANCIDGVVLFASVFEKMGLRPVYVIVPGHIFVGVELVKERPDQMLFIETTLVGQASFRQAVQAGSEAFKKAQAGKSSVVSLAKCRKAGITPFPLPVGKGFSIRSRLRGKRGAANDPTRYPDLNPERAARGWVEKGTAALKRRELGSAVRCFTQALTLDAKNPAAWVGRGDARFAQGRLDDALRDYQSAATLAPPDWRRPLQHRLRQVRRAMRRR